MNQSRIFISLAAYREPELLDTIESAIENSYNPEALHFGIFEQSVEPLNIESSTVRITSEWIHHSEALGAGYARSEVQKQYDGEEYFLQVDAHTIFTKFWDKRFINWMDRLPPKSVISMWPMPYMRTKNKIRIGVHEQGKWPVKSPHRTVASKYGRSWVGSRRALESEYEWSQVGLGGQWFCEGQFVKDVPYDPRISWHGEEFLLSVRAFDAGYEIYGVDDTLLYHNYARHGNHRVWDNDKEWNRRQAESVGIQSDLLNFCDLTEYQMKNPDRLAEYIERAELGDIQTEAKNSAIRLGVRNKSSCINKLHAVY